MGHVFGVKTLAINPAGCPDKDQKKDQNSADLGNSQITANEQKEGEKKCLKVHLVPEEPCLTLSGV